MTREDRIRVWREQRRLVAESVRRLPDSKRVGKGHDAKHDRTTDVGHR